MSAHQDPRPPALIPTSQPDVTVGQLVMGLVIGAVVGLATLVASGVLP